MRKGLAHWQSLSSDEQVDLSSIFTDWAIKDSYGLQASSQAFNLSHRDIEDLLVERGIIVTREAIRPRCRTIACCCEAVWHHSTVLQWDP